MPKEKDASNCIDLYSKTSPQSAKLKLHLKRNEKTPTQIIAIQCIKNEH